MMRRNRSQHHHLARIAVGASLFLVSVPWGCGEPDDTAETTGGETHFLTCTTDSDCTPLSSLQRCVEGVCHVSSSPLESRDGRGVATSTRADAGAACAHAAVSGPRVLVLGDTFMALTHEITGELEDIERTLGALPPGQHYRDQSTVTNNALAYGGNGISEQYSKAVADTPVEVVIMDGGGSDVLQGACAAPLQTCPVVVDAVEAARQLFTRMAADGVAHVVYAYYPDPAITAVREEVDAMRPSMEAACAESPVPCHWVDLRGVFSGHYAEYLAPDGLDPTTAGSRASASAIADVMQRYCVAQ